MKTLFNRFQYLVVISLLTGCSTIGSYDQQLAELRSEQADMKKDLDAIKKRLASRGSGRNKPAFQAVKLDITDAPFLGKNDALITLVEFSDYQCPFCKRHAKNTLPLLIKDYVDTGKIKYVLKEFPLVALHPDAMQLSAAALCAGKQGKYWAMHDQLINTPNKATPDQLNSLINSIGLNSAKFNTCLVSKSIQDQIDKDISDGRAAGISGTPGFLLGRSDPKNPDVFLATEFINGAVPFQRFKYVIGKLLSDKKP